MQYAFAVDVANLTQESVKWFNSVDKSRFYLTFRQLLNCENGIKFSQMHQMIAKEC